MSRSTGRQHVVLYLRRKTRSRDCDTNPEISESTKWAQGWTQVILSLLYSVESSNYIFVSLSFPLGSDHKSRSCQMAETDKDCLVSGLL